MNIVNNIYKTVHVDVSDFLKIQYEIFLHAGIFIFHIATMKKI